MLLIKERLQVNFLISFLLTLSVCKFKTKRKLFGILFWGEWIMSCLLKHLTRNIVKGMSHQPQGPGSGRSKWHISAVSYKP